MRMIDRRWCCELPLGVLVTAGVLILAGCPFAPQSQPAAAPRKTTIVLTFDDAPLRADVADPVVADRAVLLESLDAILATLAAHQIQAVFYIKGPGNAAAGEALRDVYMTGVAAMAAGGQILGYHAYNHAAAYWADALPDPAVPGEMQADLNELVSYLDALTPGVDALLAVVPARAPGAALYTPVFRQPFGGLGAGRSAGMRVAAEHGWAYHGFAIDSFDWVVNADVAPLLRDVPDHPFSESQLVQLVRGQLAEQARRQRAAAGAADATFDVLLHVNGLTAAHLDDWIDEFQRTLGADGDIVEFTTPAEYLRVGAAAL
jgi:peptidoglycan/xylan/chitin deacetylase (PgdA/CDA1 family)